MATDTQGPPTRSEQRDEALEGISDHLDDESSADVRRHLRKLTTADLLWLDGALTRRLNRAAHESADCTDCKEDER